MAYEVLRFINVATYFGWNARFVALFPTKRKRCRPTSGVRRLVPLWPAPAGWRLGPNRDHIGY